MKGDSARDSGLVICEQRAMAKQTCVCVCVRVCAQRKCKQSVLPHKIILPKDPHSLPKPVQAMRER
jgi:hypothetical protein